MIELFADVTCPFTHVGLRRVVERRAELRSTLPIRVKAWPLELVNGEALTGRFVAEEVAALRSEAAPDLFSGLDPAGFPTTTLPALALTSLATARSLELGEVVALDVRDAVFERGLDVGDTDVLGAIAAAHGLALADTDPDAVIAEYEEGQRLGVVGSPYFIVKGVGYFCPALDIRRVDGHFQIQSAPAAFDAFMVAAFGASAPGASEAGASAPGASAAEGAEHG